MFLGFCISECCFGLAIFTSRCTKLISVLVQFSDPLGREWCEAGSMRLISIFVNRLERASTTGHQTHVLVDVYMIQISGPNRE